jgi:hypothetical protein
VLLERAREVLAVPAHRLAVADGVGSMFERHLHVPELRGDARRGDAGRRLVPKEQVDPGLFRKYDSCAAPEALPKPATPAAPTSGAPTSSPALPSFGLNGTCGGTGGVFGLDRQNA